MSSLVAMEAAAYGTLVIAFGARASTEIVRPGQTGFLVNDVREMADAIGRALTISSGRCCDVARRSFTLEAMIADYLERYQCLASARAWA